MVERNRTISPKENMVHSWAKEGFRKIRIEKVSQRDSVHDEYSPDVQSYPKMFSLGH